MIRLLLRFLLSLSIIFLGAGANVATHSYAPVKGIVIKYPPAQSLINSDFTGNDVLVRTAWRIKGKVNDKLNTNDDDDDDDDPSTVKRYTDVCAPLFLSSSLPSFTPGNDVASVIHPYYKHFAYSSADKYILFRVIRI